MNVGIKQLVEDLEILLNIAKDDRVPGYSILRQIDDNLSEFKLKSIFTETSVQEGKE